MEEIVNERDVYFFVALAIFFVALIAVPVYYYLRHRRRKKYPYGDWESILKRLTSVDRESVALIARDLVDESGQRRTDEDNFDLDPSQIWPLIGGLKGLEVLEHNCVVLVDLVFYVQQWYPEALAITEQLRMNAREIEWHVNRLKAAEKTGRLQASFPDYAQRAVATYYLMTRRVLALYEQGNFPGLADLQSAL
jgi:hypothetical protein